MAAKLVKPDKVVLAVVGDGGFLMNSQVHPGSSSDLPHQNSVLVCGMSALHFVPLSNKRVRGLGTGSNDP